MQYLGGKHSQGKEIAAFLQSVRGDKPFIDAFCGALNVVRHIRGGSIMANDACKPLIAMWEALRDGWEPPDEVPEHMYHAVRSANNTLDPLSAFVGFGCSFGGKWFAGYARNQPQRCINYARAAKRGCLAKSADCAHVTFSNLDYSALEIPRDSLLYCDPPYAGRTGYGYAGDFDSLAFWAWANAQVSRGVEVYVSELVAPAPWVRVKGFTRKKGTGGVSGDGGYEFTDGLWHRCP